MAQTNRTAARALELMERLAGKSFAFGFFQALRQIENAFPDKPRLGTSKHASEDPVRFGQEASLIFAPTAIAAFHPGADGRPPRLNSYFFGLLGPNAPLPLHLTEFARDRQRNAGDATLVRFLDIFHHRMTSLFYRAWAVNQPTVSFDRPDEDPFGNYVASLFGQGMPSLRDRDAFPDLARLHFAGLFASQARHPDGLRAIIHGFFRVPVAIEEFVGGWLHLPTELRCRLGESPESGSLGRTAAIGGRVWSCHHKFRIRLGPLTLAQYVRLLPGGESLRRLVPLLRSYVGDELEWDVNLVLKPEDVPALRLDGSARLGWTSWLKSRRVTEAARQLRLKPLGGLG